MKTVRMIAAACLVALCGCESKESDRPSDSSKKIDAQIQRIERLQRKANQYGKDLDRAGELLRATTKMERLNAEVKEASKRMEAAFDEWQNLPAGSAERAAAKELVNRRKGECQAKLDELKAFKGVEPDR